MRNISPGKYAVSLYEVLQETDPARHQEMLSSFLKIVIRNGDASKFRRILSAFRTYANEKEGIAEVSVTTATAMDSGLQDRVKSALEAQLHRRVILREQVSPDLVAGIVVRYGDTVIDGSMRRHLVRLAQTLKSR